MEPPMALSRLVNVEKKKAQRLVPVSAELCIVLIGHFFLADHGSEMEHRKMQNSWIYITEIYIQMRCQ